MSHTQTNGAFRPVFCHRDSCPATLDCKFCSECGADIAAYRRSTEDAQAILPVDFSASAADARTAVLPVASPVPTATASTRSIRPSRMNSDDEFTGCAPSASPPNAAALTPRRSFPIIAGFFGGGLVLGAVAGAVVNFV
jgi:hypothetical protein